MPKQSDQAKAAIVALAQSSAERILEVNLTSLKKRAGEENFQYAQVEMREGTAVIIITMARKKHLGDGLPRKLGGLEVEYRLG